MLEEDKCTMERKGPSRQSSVPPPKGNGPSADKKNDNNKFSRNNRKRETNGNGRGGSDNWNRRPAPQKWRTTNDKRPRSRTLNPSDRQREEVAGSYLDERGSDFRSKKGNLNHLLNFSFAPREVDAFVGGSFRRTKTNRVRFDKKRFLQANCQFIVKDTGDYSLQLADPDVLVDWNLVELVRLYSYEKPSCPICLDTPIAAKVTCCGHLYCWSCILHILSLEDGSWAECPICYSPVLEKDIRSAECIVLKRYKVGDNITMKLMKREPGTSYSVPVDIWSDRNGKQHKYHDEKKFTKYMKILLASPSEILSDVIEREKISLETQLQDTEDSEICFIETAQNQLKEREIELKIRADVETSLCIKTESTNESKTKESITERVKTVSVSSDEYPVITAGRFKTFSESSISDTDIVSELPADVPKSRSVPADLYQGACAANLENSIPEECVSETDLADLYQGACAAEGSDLANFIPEEYLTEPELMSDVKSGVQKPKLKHVYATKNGYFCFQAEDGQQIYIHSINSRCLTHEYSSLESSPNQITAKIIDIKTLNMTDELRSRTKYLSHLPLSSEYQIVELDLKPPILSRSTLDIFQSEIDRKRKSRQRKEKTERQREKKIFLEENQKLGIYPGLKISLQSEYQFPSQIMKQDAPPLHSQRNAIFPEETLSTSPSSSQTSENLDDKHSVSFAQMLQNGPGKSPVPVWPKLKTSVESSPVVKTAVLVDSDGSEIEDYVPVPEYGQSFGHAIQAALDNSIVNKPESKTPQKTKGGKNKKKNKKVKVLFSTSMSRGNTE